MYQRNLPAIFNNVSIALMWLLFKTLSSLVFVLLTPLYSRISWNAFFIKALSSVQKFALTFAPCKISIDRVFSDTFTDVDFRSLILIMHATRNYMSKYEIFCILS
uniref:Uncharacterized protein n=1 Tax=Rhipicephalus microplus TaxID=6941 RepID=A0A6G5A3T1_RHIMP